MSMQIVWFVIGVCTVVGYIVDRIVDRICKCVEKCVTTKSFGDVAYQATKDKKNVEIIKKDY